jgi:hypothetical protein
MRRRGKAVAHELAEILRRVVRMHIADHYKLLLITRVRRDRIDHACRGLASALREWSLIVRETHDASGNSLPTRHVGIVWNVDSNFGLPGVLFGSGMLNGPTYP